MIEFCPLFKMVCVCTFWQATYDCPFYSSCSFKPTNRFFIGGDVEDRDEYDAKGATSAVEQEPHDPCFSSSIVIVCNNKDENDDDDGSGGNGDEELTCITW